MKTAQLISLGLMATLFFSCSANKSVSTVDLNSSTYKDITLTHEQIAPMKKLIGQAQRDAGLGQLELAYAKADLATAQIELLLLQRADELNIGPQAELALAIKHSEEKIEEFQKQVQNLSPTKAE